MEGELSLRSLLTGMSARPVYNLSPFQVKQI